MDRRLIEILSQISEEEQAILNGNQTVQQQIYTSSPEFVVDSRKLLKRGKLIDVRHHTRFVHFPRHRHNYVEMVYMYQGSTTHILENGERVELQQGDLLLLNQNAVHEILPAGEGDIAINFLVMPELQLLSKHSKLSNCLSSITIFFKKIQFGYDIKIVNI